MGVVTYMMTRLVLFLTESDWRVETVILPFMVYASFGIAENILKVSGVLTTVVFGLAMSMHGNYQISPESVEITEKFNQVSPPPRNQSKNPFPDEPAPVVTRDDPHPGV